MRSNSFDTKLVKQTKGGGEGSAFVGKAAIFDSSFISIICQWSQLAQYQFHKW